MRGYLRITALKCVDFYEDSGFLSINYWKEAKNIPLKVKYNDTLQKGFPIILAFGSFCGDDILHLDFRSFERVGFIIELIDKHIERDIAEVESCATVNEIYAIQEKEISNLPFPPFDNIFTDEKMVIRDGEKIMGDLEERAKVANKDEKMEILSDFMEDMINRPFDLIEKFPVNYYSDGIVSLNAALNFRQTLAIEHFQGRDTKPFELTLRLVKSKISKAEEVISSIANHKQQT